MTPDENTNQELFIPVGQNHTLYVHDWGNAEANTPIVFLHGGPGGSCDDSKKSLFDPQHHRVIFFDQRGCGRSTPYGSLHGNTTEELITDIHTIIDTLGIATCVLMGRSWGSTLALAYAIHHSDRVAGLIIGGIFTATTDEIDYITNGRYALLYPDVWEAFQKSVPSSDQHHPWQYHARHILGDDEEAMKRSAYASMLMEYGLVRLDDRTRPVPYDTFDPMGIRLETQYAMQNYFLTENFITQHLDAIRCPAWIIQGRYDALCPPQYAYQLHQRLSDSHLLWTIGGHSGSDRETWSTIKAVTHHYAL